VPVSPIHHGSDRQFANNGNAGIYGVFVIFGWFYRLWHFGASLADFCVLTLAEATVRLRQSP
jgi:hypothetical protein